MNDKSCEKIKFVVSKAIRQESSLPIKKNWQTPQLTELNTAKTEDGPGIGVDGDEGELIS